MITLSNIHLAFRNKKLFESLNIDFQSNRIYGLFGSNGAGKSTILNLIAGYIGPDTGTVRVLGQSPYPGDAETLQEIFIVTEDGFIANSDIKEFLRINVPFYPKFNYDQFSEYLEHFKIPPAADIRNASFGQRKKITISFALACNTSVLLMDEPTNGLDLISCFQFRKIIAGVSNHDKCIIISTHNVKDISNLIDAAVIIDNGKVLFNQPLEDITRHLTFRFSNDPEEIRQSIFNEEVLGGTMLITRRTLHPETAIDLEMLYKAVLLENSNISSLFK